MQLNLDNRKLEGNYIFKLLNDSIDECPISYKLVLITVGGVTFLGNLIQFDLSDFDIILGMNWLRTYGTKVNYVNLKVILRMKV